MRNICLLFSTARHPQTEDISERIKQIAVIALLCAEVEIKEVRTWLIAMDASHKVGMAGWVNEAEE